MPDPSSPPRTLPLVDPVSGDFFDIPEGDAPYYLDRGWKSQTAADVGAAALQGAREIDYGGIAGAAKAGLAAGARGATLGASDVAARLIGGDETADTLRNLREAHPGLSAGVEIAGAILPAFLSGGESLPASLAARAGRGAAEAAGGGIRGALVGGAAEGALFGAGQGVSDLALSQDPLTIEHAAAAIGGNALYGAAAGGAGGGALKSVEAGLGSAKRALDRALLARSEGRAVQAIANLEADAAARPPGIGTEVEIEYPEPDGPAFSPPERAPPAPPRPTSDALLERNKATIDISFEAGRKKMPDGISLRMRVPGSESIDEDGVNGLVTMHRGADGRFYVEDTRLAGDLRGKGIGMAMYERLNAYMEAKYGQTLLSDAADYRSSDGESLWRRLEGRGLARRVGPDVNGRPERWEMLSRRSPEPGIGIHEDLPPVTPPMPMERASGLPKIPLSSLDKAGLKAAREQEIAAFHAAQVPERQAFVDDLRVSREAFKEEKPWIATANGKTREVREIGKLTLEADRRVDQLLKVEQDLVDKPQKALSALRQQEQALGKLQEWGERETQRYVDEVAGARDQIRADLLANKYRDQGFVFGRGAISPSSPVVDDIAERLFQAKYPTPDRLPTNLQVLNAVPGALERNRALQDRLAKLAESPTSPRLTAIDQAEEALGVRTAPPKSAPEASPIGEVLKVAAHAVPFGGLAARAAGALGGLRKAVSAGAERAARAASTFLGKAAPVVGRAASLAPPVATKVLAALRYGEPATDERGKPVAKPEPKTLPELYRARTDEIRSQVQLASDGTYQMRPAARAKMAARLSGLGAIDPIAADRLESAGALWITWLASQMPQRPDLAGLPVGPDNWNPSDAAMRSWTRKAAAAEDPYGVLERASAGAKARVVPEEVMALRALQPALLNDYITRIIAGLPERKERLPYAQRLALSMLTGRPLDPAMTPIVLRELQSMHAGEPGTAGGTMAPRASPQFGSVKRSEPGTPAQRRQGVGL